MENNESTAGDEEKKARSEDGVDLDTILVEEIGQFGPYQLRTVALAVLVVIFSGWHAEYVFTAARVDTRCLIPECEDSGAGLQFVPDWILNAVPAVGDAFDNCQRFANASDVDKVVMPDTCPASLFDQQSIVSCETYVYENTDSVVYDFNLACDEWRRSLIGSMRTMGTLIAQPLTGFVSDRWGRRMALALNAFNTCWLGLARFWARTYVGFVISEVAEAAFGSGVFSCVYILLMELVGPKYRVFVGAAMSTCFAVGQATLGLIAWAVPNWKNLTLALYIPQVLTISYFWLISESIRWYWSKGRHEECEKCLKEVARINGKQLSDKSLLALRRTAANEELKKTLDMQEKRDRPWLVILVLRTKPILLRCVVSPVLWVATTFIYYGLTINSVNMSGNPYANYVAVSMVEIPGFWISFVLMGRVGRKPVLAGAFWICAACQLGYLFIPDGLYAVSLAVYLVGKCSIASVVTALYVYTNELYPTECRHSLFAFSSMLGRVGAILAPLTPAFGDTLPFILFGGLALLAGLLVLLTPETLGAKFPDTLDEAAHIGDQKNMPHS